MGLHYRIQSKVVEGVQALSLEGVAAASVVPRWLPIFAPGEDGPKILVCMYGRETFEGSLNNRDDIGYPITVALYDDDFGNAKNLNRNSTWRENIISRFRFQRLAGVSEVQTCRPEALDIVTLGQLQQNSKFLGAFVLRFVTRTGRG